jgi:hypothetical protein
MLPLAYHAAITQWQQQERPAYLKGTQERKSTSKTYGLDLMGKSQQHAKRPVHELKLSDQNAAEAQLVK